MNNYTAVLPHIHVLTVHWQTPKWIDIQLSYLKRNLNSSYTTYSFLNGIEPEYHKRFDFSYDQDIASHAEKLNILARKAADNAKSTRDILLFIDGDAFPIQPIDSHLIDWLSHYPLAAVQRLEENHELQPHPCFCATTIKFWQQIRGDWRQGYSWQDQHGNEVTDVGGNLLGALERKQIKWKPLLRSNQIDLHPIWFAVYDDVVYHHGAGFRKPISRIDLHNTSRWQYKLTDSLYNRLPASSRFDKWRERLAPHNIRGDKIAAKNQIICDRIFGEIKNNKEFYRHFLKIEKYNIG
jgi:hypothetical protein